jgi:hypothetical protein
MRCIYCDRLNPPCGFRPIIISLRVLGVYKTGACCHDCDRRLRTDGAALLSELSYAMRSASDT